MIPQTTPRLSLFQIEAELLQLIDAREDALERMSMVDDSPPNASEESCLAAAGMAEEIATINGLIKQYIGREIRKVDGIAFAIKEHEARAVARVKAAEELKASADRDAETAKRIKAMVLEVMQEFGEKKLPGRLFTITRQGNGGVQALTIAQPDLVPLQAKCITIELSAWVWEAFAEEFSGRYRVVAESHPDARFIRETIDRGIGVPGCKLEERGEHIRIK